MKHTQNFVKLIDYLCKIIYRENTFVSSICFKLCFANVCLLERHADFDFWSLFVLYAQLELLKTI